MATQTIARRRPLRGVYWKRTDQEPQPIPVGSRAGKHTLRHSYAQHLLVHGIQVNYLSHWLGR